MRRLILAIVAMALAHSAFAGDAAKGREKAKTCEACHGPEGNKPILPDYPRLAGQYPDYLIFALSHYKSGKRKSPIMMPMVSTLSAQDIADIAAYFASVPGGVQNKY